MRLLPRVNYILMPVIIVVFSFSGWWAYEQYYKTYKQYLRQSLEQELSFIQQQIELEKNSFQSVLLEIGNSQEFLQFTTADRDPYQILALESRLISMMSRIQRNNPNIKRIDLIDNNDILKISVPIKDPFSRPFLDIKALTFLENSRQARLEAEGNVLQYLFYPHNDKNTMRFAATNTLSPLLLLEDRANNSLTERYTIMISVELEFFDQIKRRIARQFGEEFIFDYDVNDGNLTKNIQVISDENGLRGGLETKFYSINISISESNISDRLESLRIFIIITLIAIIIFSFSVLSALIRYQIISPIRQLKERIITSRQQHKPSLLSYMDTDDEVAELNNSYLELLDDVDRLASSDALTGLDNRHNFQKKLSEASSKASTNKKCIAILYIDLDNFKQVNDHYGHVTGDMLLKKFADELRQIVRHDDIVGIPKKVGLSRLGGDEFVVMLEEIPNKEVAIAVADRILKLFESGFKVNGVRHNVQASIGISVSSGNDHNAITLLHNADAAMYHAKANGKNCCEFFTPDIALAMQKKHVIANDLSKALATEDLRLRLMPIYAVEPFTIIGAEVLLSCPMLERQGIGADQFIPIAESTGLIKDIDLWVIDNALSSLKRLQIEHNFSGYLAINISGVELYNKFFPEKLKCALQKHHILPSSVEVELTETALVSDTNNSVHILEQIKNLGVSLSLDDFGTGYTAFNQLIHFPVDCLKIDRSFVDGIGKGVEAEFMIDTIMTLAKLYQLKVVAEGVETLSQYQYLKSIGCPYVQGYLLSQPVMFEDFTELLKTSQENIK